MNIVREFSQLYHNDIKPMFFECFSKLEKSEIHLKDKIVDVLKTADKAMRQLIVYYPKTMLISFIASAIFTVLFPTIGGYIGLAINGYVFIRHQNFMFSAIKIYKENNVSELFSSYTEKKRLESLIYLGAFGKEILERITNFFRRTF